MIVLTVGKSYVDIDGYASCLAYRELLKMLKIESKVISVGNLNYSITKSLLNLPYHIDDYKIKPDDKFIVLDLSDKQFFPDFVKEESIIELIDHHPGFEEYWTAKLKNNAVIEQIGAVATIIVEKYEQYNLIHKMDKSIAKLLMAAILDNTLNFTAKITNTRDKIAYKKLVKIADEYNFDETYFKECQETVEYNLEESIVNDLKFQEANEYIPNVFGQITIWNINHLLDKKEKIRQTMNKYGEKWMINIISLNDNRSYIIYSDDKVKYNLSRLFEYNFNNDIIILKPAMLRKEIIGKSLSKK